MCVCGGGGAAGAMLRADATCQLQHYEPIKIYSRHVASFFLKCGGGGATLSKKIKKIKYLVSRIFKILIPVVFQLHEF